MPRDAIISFPVLTHRPEPWTLQDVQAPEECSVALSVALLAHVPARLFAVVSMDALDPLLASPSDVVPVGLCSREDSP